MGTDFFRSGTHAFSYDMEKPRERAMERGIESLDDSELVAILLRTGTRGKNVIGVADEMFDKFDRSFIKMRAASLDEFLKISGVGKAKALTIQAALEIGQRLWRESLKEKKFLKSADDVYEFCKDMLLKNVEYVRVIVVDSQLGAMAVKDVTIGTANASLIHPREIFNVAIRYPSAGVIIVHNHPSGNPAPSREDEDATYRIKNAGEILGIKLIDHIVVASKGFYSFSKSGKL
uniref:JAB domain-containing protein n=1 Tax=Mesoaciditoga lauensis TaxID=1495039 RepID=A0A7V3REC2_9BACT